MKGEEWLDIVTHMISAALGGGLARLYQARAENRHIDVKKVAQILGALEAERDWQAKGWQECRDECQLYRRALWRLRQGVLVLQAQVRQAGMKPAFTINGEITAGLAPGEEEEGCG